MLETRAHVVATPMSPAIESYYLSISVWLVLLISGVPVAFAALRWRRTINARLRGCCRKCGYDLRGSGGDCPECGAARPSDAASRGLALPVVGDANHGAPVG